MPLEGKHGEESIVYVMQQSGVVGRYVFEQLDGNRKEFQNLKFTDFLIKMNTTDKYFIGFQKYLEDNGVILNLANNKTLVKRYIAAEFARQLFDEQKYYEILISRRFEKRIYIPLPDFNGRLEMLRLKICQNRHTLREEDLQVSSYKDIID